MSEYLSGHEFDMITKEINKRLCDVVNLLINQYSDYDIACDIIDTIASLVENEMFNTAVKVLDQAERDPAGYFDLPQPTYDKEVLPEDDDTYPGPLDNTQRAKLFWFG
jgi:hypothetical protein